ncbi:hypothetical protein TNCV_1183521 [Trichonephila clavipes]|nr:hypothetical protein TNCV_1183521 [Trichonephila clavipes]
MVVSGTLGLVVSRDEPRRESDLWMYPLHHEQNPTRFKQHRVITTRPMNCYAKVSPRLGRSRHRFFFSRRDVDSRS